MELKCVDAETLFPYYSLFIPLDTTKSRFNILLPPACDSSKLPFPLSSSTKSLLVLIPYHACYMSHALPPLLFNINDIWRIASYHEYSTLILRLPPSLAQIFSSASSFQTPKQCCSLSVKDKATERTETWVQCPPHDSTRPYTLQLWHRPVRPATFPLAV
jgi:hypothetical protein